MAYQLGNVKPHVRAAADHFGPAHDIRTVGGWRARGSVPNSDHPKGLALDFMTGSRAQGDALARDLITNAKDWGVTYVIWWRQIWRPGKGWAPYSGPSPHTDHVHASFASSATVPDPGTRPPGQGQPAGSLLDPLGVAGAIKDLSSKVGQMASSVAEIGAVANLLTKAFLPTNMVRTSAAFAGTIFILIGIWFLSREIRNS